ncbi:ABC transporter permease subunit [Streptantibioticus cattleyicolor]|uniref:Putative ABC transporter transmembrane protein n=1 Tax=Streptantibioticus cattleyicolor (strain ATCC 35852 / DSM 46488 / JCM 4925 / NBRC 14057 / NRRL 8057) TaxID=1003195 RepID=F8JLY7_STREN|nr:ABC transporter permease subunit [Streptantibioticus cattleyicolor]AEW98203.1 putative ABC transporter transmembrane protein [Streptantibioticus cattleyicolor NRRL 8057 = DSM 46488]CCB72732.1 putative ABC transporter transmembrane protein [Streptantibioticus cattleyicolor NRRL 8057 = DSM 46488]
MSAATAPVATAPATGRRRVTLPRVVTSEWIKFRSLRSTYLTLLIGVVVMIGIAALACWATANRWPHLPMGEKEGFDAAGRSIDGFMFAQLAIGVLGVLVISGEYATGMIRATLAAVPKRLPVLWAKLLVFGSVTLVVTAVASLVSFFVGQAMLSAQHIQTSLSASGVPRVVLGTALYLTLVGLFGVGMGTVTRSTPGGIAGVFGTVLVLPLILHALPSSWVDAIGPYLPSNAGQALTVLHAEPHQLAPWTGFGVFCLYVAAVIAAGAVVLKRRDA